MTICSQSPTIWAKLNLMDRLIRWLQVRTLDQQHVMIVPRWVVLLLLTSLFLGEAYGTRQRNRVWQTELSLWTDTVAKSPNNGRALMNLGVNLMARGEYGLARYYFERSKLYNPEYDLLEVNFGVLSAAQGYMRESEFHFRQAIFLNPKDRQCYTYYAEWLRKWGRPKEADNLMMLGGWK